MGTKFPFQKFIKEKKPNLVLMDIVVKGEVDGFQATKMIT